jgi:hypothetical protein
MPSPKPLPKGEGENAPSCVMPRWRVRGSGSIFPRQMPTPPALQNKTGMCDFHPNRDRMIRVSSGFRVLNYASFCHSENHLKMNRGVTQGRSVDNCSQLDVEISGS